MGLAPVGYEGHWFGANEYVVRFDSGVTKKIKLREMQWE